MHLTAVVFPFVSVALIVIALIIFKINKYRRSRTFQEETQPLTATPQTQIYQGL